MSQHTAIQLESQVTGKVVTPDHPDYDTARQAWNLSVDQHPAVILFAENAQDIVAGVNFAREAGLGVAAQATGHGTQQNPDGGLLIITSHLKGVQVDAETRTVKVEAGALWHHVLDAVTPHGLAPLLGSSPYVGVVGYTLGAGYGWLVRAHGLAADSVRSIDVVTADGVLRHASADENTDLFWGLRGGGGSFGIVTGMEFALYPVSTIYGGTLTYPGDVARDALRFFRDWIKTVPNELTSSLTLFKVPPLPQIPAPMHGKVMVMLRAVYAGDSDEGKKFIQQWLDWKQPRENSFAEMPFSDIGKVSNDPVQPSAGIGSSEMFDAELSDEAIDVIVQYSTAEDAAIAIADFRHVGTDAISSVPADANAIGNRHTQILLSFGGPIAKPEAYDSAVAYIARYSDAIKPYTSGGIYLNFTKGDDARERVRKGFSPESFERLQALKAEYDPDNMFSFAYQFTEADPA